MSSFPATTAFRYGKRTEVITTVVGPRFGPTPEAEINAERLLDGRRVARAQRRGFLPALRDIRRLVQGSDRSGCVIPRRGDGRRLLGSDPTSLTAWEGCRTRSLPAVQGSGRSLNSKASSVATPTTP